MKFLPIICTLALSLAAGGCAKKSFVTKSIAPVNAKVDEQGKTLAETTESLHKTQQTVEANETVLNATRERAASADARAGDALNRAGDAATKATDAASKADQATQRADAAGRDVGTLKTDVDKQFASMDDYKKVTGASVNFKFNSDRLDKDAMAQLDEMAASPAKYKRYFLAVEGFSDQTGDQYYNAALSRRRADAVVTYLVSHHDIPVYRIQMVGLGEAKPVDEGKTAAARAKNRRVEITLYSADANAVAQN